MLITVPFLALSGGPRLLRLRPLSADPQHFVSPPPPDHTFDAHGLRAAVSKMKVDATEEELSHLMRSIDGDKDGIISFEEFVDFVNEEGDCSTLVGRLKTAIDDRTPPVGNQLEVLSRVQQEARILDGGSRDASTYDAKDWTRVLWSWPSSFVARRVRSPLVGLSAWALAVAAVHRLELFPSFVLSTVLGASMPGAGITKTLTLAGAALSLLLVFRTNTAYQRYAEGRKVWEMLCTAARDSVELCGSYMTEISERRLRKVAGLLCAFPLALQFHLQGQPIPSEPKEVVRKNFLDLVHRSFFSRRQDGHTVPLDVFVAACRADECLATKFSLPNDVDARVALQQLHQLKFGSPRERDTPVSLGELEAYYNPLAIANMVPADVRASLARSRCAPLHIARLLMREAKSIPYDGERFSSRERLALMNTFARLRSCVGSAERIAQTPVPVHYARHALRFLTLWSMLLPLALVDQLGFLVVPVTAFMVWALYGLREIGTLIENPFSRPLQLQIVSETLYIDVKEAVDYAVGNRDCPRSTVADLHYHRRAAATHQNLNREYLDHLSEGKSPTHADNITHEAPDHHRHSDDDVYYTIKDNAAHIPPRAHTDHVPPPPIYPPSLSSQYLR